MDLAQVFRQGYSLIPDFLEPSQCNRLHQEMLSLQVDPAAEIYGKARQKLSLGYYYPEDLQNMPETFRLLQDYMQHYQANAASLNFCQSRPHLAFNVYPAGGYIEAHYDESKYRNLIASFTFLGSSPFAIHSNRQNKVVEFDLLPGSLLLLAAPRNAQEKSIRPLHSVGPAYSERFNLVIRQEAVGV